MLEQAAGLHLQVAVDDVDREALRGGEQAADATLTQGVDDERLLVVDFGRNGVLVVFLDAVGLLVDEVAAVLVDEEYDQQAVALVELAQVGQLPLHAVVVKEVGIQHEQAALAHQTVGACNECRIVALGKVGGLAVEALEDVVHL